MTIRAPEPKDLTFVLNTEPLGPTNTVEQRVIREKTNALYEAARAGLEQRVVLGMELQTLVDNFSGVGHENPAWVVPTVRGNANYAIWACVNSGDTARFDAAVRCHETAFLAASRDLEKGKSANNLSDLYARAGNYARALEFGRMAVACMPDDDAVVVTIASSLFDAGMQHEADQLLGMLASGDRRARLTAELHSRFDGRLARMQELGSVARLVADGQKG